MKFAIVNGDRREPQKGLIATCVGCSHPMIAKCGDKRVHHWAHKNGELCDHWWEPETEWHRNWKDKFPVEWQESRHSAANGEIHIADVKTAKDWVLEFQYSAISPEERSSRIEFYPKLVWIVNGLRRKKDPEQFFASLKLVKNVEDCFFRRAFDVVSDKGALLRDWSSMKVPIFFDFGQSEVLWCLLPIAENGKAIVVEVIRQVFVDLQIVESPRDIFDELLSFAASATSAEDLFLKFHFMRREEERKRQLIAEEARRRNPYINRRAGFRF